jgi:hypothetical protein
LIFTAMTATYTYDFICGAMIERKVIMFLQQELTAVLHKLQGQIIGKCFNNMRLFQQINFNAIYSEQHFCVIK